MTTANVVFVVHVVKVVDVVMLFLFLRRLKKGRKIQCDKKLRK
jgi:hypothetical protein